MRYSLGPMPIYPGKRAGTFRVVVWSRGKATDRTVRGTKREAALFESRLRIELEANQHDARNVLRFAELCTEKYSPFARANLARSTWRARSYVIENLVLFFGKKKLTAFVMADTEGYKAERAAEGVGPSTINGELRAFLTVLHWAKRNGYPVTIPPVRYLREPEGRVRIWTSEELTRLLAHAQATRPEMHRLIIFLVNTGCRKGESIAAEWSWVDLKANLIRIPASREWSPKSGRAREVPISDACRAILDMPKELRRSERFIFPNRDGVRFEFFPDAVFKELEDRAKIDGGPHTLRHVFASIYLANGGTMFDLAKILGHSHERITAIYSHLLPGHLEKSRNLVNVGTMDSAMSTPKRRSKTA